MATVVFVFGRPGSGKSTIARYIKEHKVEIASNPGEERLSDKLSVVHVNDYSFLQKMFHKERTTLEQGHALERRQFRVGDKELGGFSVIDFSVLETALESVNTYVLEKMKDPDTLILIEFARRSYLEALEHFALVLENPHTYFLYLDVELDVCARRVYKRAIWKEHEDDNFVADEIMQTYYSQDDLPLLRKTLEPEMLKVVQNNGDLSEVCMSVQKVLWGWCVQSEPALF